MKTIVAKCLVSAFILFFSFSCHNSVQDSDRLPGKKSSDQTAYAQRFTISEYDGFKKLTIKDPWQGAKNITQDYFLFRRGSEVPDSIARDKVIFTPIERIICLSTTHIAMICALNMESTIIGVSGADYIYNDYVATRAMSGLIKDVGYEENLNKELILDLSPDIVMVYGIGNESSGYLGKLKELGVKVIFNADYLEENPLGKAEWIKVIGALYDKESEADSLFTNIEEQYNSIKAVIASNTITRPTVLLGLPWKDTWFISPGNTYVSKLIEDAGGEYLWKDDNSEISMPYGIENVFTRALDADYWLNIGSVNSKDEITALDNRLVGLKPFVTGKLYNNTNRLNSSGGNDYWESGSINPQAILKDLAIILHPELFDEKNLVFYKLIK